jgi:membrane-associated phospholipid phosphatase
MYLKQLRVRVLFLPAMALALCASAAGQMTGGPNPLPDASSVSLPDAPLPQTADAGQAGDKDRVTLLNTPVHILKDQAAIWTSPARVREHDFAYLLPLALVTTVAITADHQAMSSSKLNNTSLNNHADTASKGLLGGFVAAPVILYGLGGIHHNAHATETGILAGEAMVDSLVVDEVLKAATMRERPTLDGAKGKFFQRSVGLDSSFPSTHSILAWSSAAVIASEYPGPMTKITAYGLATGLSLTRVLGRQHFPSDVLVGSAVGWLVGRYVYHKHHREPED